VKEGATIKRDSLVHLAQFYRSPIRRKAEYLSVFLLVCGVCGFFYPFAFGSESLSVQDLAIAIIGLAGLCTGWVVVGAVSLCRLANDVLALVEQPCSVVGNTDQAKEDATKSC
jgi:hypothetical protein